MSYTFIRKLSVFDVQHIGRIGAEKRSTLLSLDIDGTRIYSVKLPRVVYPSSGGNTVGLFRTEDKRSLYAWIDPISGECYITSEMRTWEAMLLAVPLAMVAVAFSVSRDFGGVSTFMSVLALTAPVIAAAIWRRKKMREIENTLRTVLTSQSTTTH